ncbi:MAG: 4Fe-4S binding protein [Spirochaetales bacterium]|nr:4Fe-4S binding protein [Spirochaetales bacterium]
MTSICVASGKGGAGKTSMAAALASSLGAPVIFADCDVDAANGAIALGAIEKERTPYFAGPGFSIEASACTGCGRCFTACRFGAIEADNNTGLFSIVPELCERCGACVDVCPTKAIVTFEKQAGVLFVSEGRGSMPLVHAELEPGEDTSGKLVAVVRKRAEAIASNDSIIVIDAPPGIGCPVIASLTGTDLVLVVVEASSSGIRDAARLVELIVSMKRKALAVINKTGLDDAMDEKARSMLSDAGIPLVGEIPFDPALRSAEESGRTWAEIRCEATDSIRALLDATIEAIGEAGGKSARPMSATS